MAISFDGMVTPEKFFPQQNKTIDAPLTTGNSIKGQFPTVRDDGNIVTTSVGGAPVVPEQDCPRFSTYGAAYGEMAISLSGTIQEHFNGFFNPPKKIAQSDGMHREEAARRLSSQGVTYVFVNTGKKITKCDVVGAAQSLLTIPNTTTIQFIAFYIAKYNGYYYVGEDNSLYTLEIKRNEMPPEPPNTTLGSGKWLYDFEDGDIKSNEDVIETFGMWSGNVGNLTTFHTSSLQSSGSKRFNIQVYNKAISDCTSQHEFSIAYGNSNGSGSYDFGGYDNLTATKAIYGQYRSILLESSQSLFRFGDTESTSIYIITPAKGRIGDSIDPGNIELNLHHLNGTDFTELHPLSAYTGSNIELSSSPNITRLIDDSRINDPTITSAGRVYNIKSGSLELGVTSQPIKNVVFGKLYADVGAIILNGDALDLYCRFATITTSEVSASNYMQLFTAISGAAQYTDPSGDILGFQARKTKRIHSTYYYVRAKNDLFNFSNNPTYVTGSEGDIVSDFINNSNVYITTVGLYNRRKELLAVGKLSQPIIKNYTEEALITVDLRYE